MIATTLTGGQIGEKYRYLPYGGIDRVEVVTGNAQSELSYTGALKLSGSLLHLNARVYDTASGRFLQPDVLDALRYTYAAGDPVGLVDPSGRLPLDPVKYEYTREAMPEVNENFLVSLGWFARVFAGVGKGVGITIGNPETWDNARSFFGGSAPLFAFIDSLPTPQKEKEAKEMTAGTIPADSFAAAQIAKTSDGAGDRLASMGPEDSDIATDAVDLVAPAGSPEVGSGIPKEAIGLLGDNAAEWLAAGVAWTVGNVTGAACAQEYCSRRSTGQHSDTLLTCSDIFNRYGIPYSTHGADGSNWSKCGIVCSQLINSKRYRQNCLP